MLLSELCDWSLVDERTLSEELGGSGGGGGGGEKESRVILESKVDLCFLFLFFCGMESLVVYTCERSCVLYVSLLRSPQLTLVGLLLPVGLALSLFKTLPSVDLCLLSPFAKLAIEKFCLPRVSPCVTTTHHVFFFGGGFRQLRFHERRTRQPPLLACLLHMQTQTAALELIVSVLQTYGGPRFRALPAAATLVRGELCAALLHHCTSNVTGLVSLSLRVFVALIKGFKVRQGADQIDYGPREVEREGLADAPVVVCRRRGVGGWDSSSCTTECPDHRALVVFF